MTTFRIDPGHVAYLKLRTGRDYESFGFDSEYFQTLLDHMGADQSSLDARQFVSDHFNLLSGYLQAEQHYENRITIEDENKELARIQDQARQLAVTLESLAGYGRAGQRLHQELATLDLHAFRHEETTIAKMLGHFHYRPFGGLSSLLHDLQIGLERAKIAKPGQKDSPKLTGDPQKDEKAQADHTIRHFAGMGPEGASAENYQARHRANKLPTQTPLATFLLLFREIWDTYSPLPFTEGRYEIDAHQTISRTVDAARHCLDRFGAPHSQSLVASKMREVREERIGWE